MASSKEHKVSRVERMRKLAARVEKATTGEQRQALLLRFRRAVGKQGVPASGAGGAHAAVYLRQRNVQNAARSAPPSRVVSSFAGVLRARAR